jgi:AcrR family transcriptional regulator
MTTQREDRRVARTRQVLAQALVELIQERGYEALSVQDLLDRANVGRSTFYAHYEDKEDLLLQGLESLQEMLQQRQREALDKDGAHAGTFAFTTDLLEHAHAHRGLFKAMVGKHSGTVVVKHFERMLAVLVRNELKAAARARKDAVPLDAVVQYVAGGLSGLLAWWMDEGRHAMPASEINDLFLKLARPAVALVR